MSSLRARCPFCRTLTAVAVDFGYQCHSCGREFAAGLVRVPRAWGTGGDAMAQAAALQLPYPETAVVDRDSLEDQSATLAESLPARPVVLGGCCCAHVGAARGLAKRGGRLGIVWFDAHGDLNTPDTSPSGNLWGMPFRMILDEDLVAPADAALVGARNLDPPEVAFLAETGIDDSLDRALDGVDGVYIAFDFDVLEPGEAVFFMPEPDGLLLTTVEQAFRDIASRARVLGLGLTGLVPGDENVAAATRLAAAAGL